MKPSIGFIITFFVIMGFVMINIALQSNIRRKLLDLRNKQIMSYVQMIEGFKEELKRNPDETISKSDLAAFTEMNFYQSQIDKLYMENDLELAKGYPKVFPDYLLLILILWMSFQLDKIYKQINKQAE